MKCCHFDEISTLVVLWMSQMIDNYTFIKYTAKRKFRILEIWKRHSNLPLFSLSSSNWNFFVIGIISHNIFLTHWGRGKMVAFSQMTFSHAFSWMRKYEFQLTFHWSLFLRFKLTIFQYLVQIMAWCLLGNKPLSESRLFSLCLVYV